jgi:hypothetical protein
VTWALTWTMVFDGRPYFFWPAFPIVARGIAVVTHGFVAYGRAGYPKEAQIQRELKKLHHI